MQIESSNYQLKFLLVQLIKFVIEAQLRCDCRDIIHYLTNLRPNVLKTLKYSKYFFFCLEMGLEYLWCLSIHVSYVEEVIKQQLRHWFSGESVHLSLITLGFETRLYMNLPPPRKGVCVCVDKKKKEIIKHRGVRGPIWFGFERNFNQTKPIGSCTSQSIQFFAS